MKRVELHLHLDGSLDVAYASKLMGRDVSKELISVNDKTLKDYLTKFAIPCELLKNKDNIYKFCSLLGKSLRDDNVIYAEVRYCPCFHVGELSLDEVVKTVSKAFKEVKDIKINTIICLHRNVSYEQNLEMLEVAKKYYGKGVAALDLAGDEAGFPTITFKELFDKVKESGIPYTIHAGEADGVSSVKAALDFGTKRLGHGVRAIEDKELIKRIIKDDILLEVCPKSNLDTRLVDDIKKHPIKELVDMGVKVCINTDNRTVSNTTLRNEYKLLRDNFGFTKEQFKQFNINALDKAFISDAEREKLKKEIMNS